MDNISKRTVVTSALAAIIAFPAAAAAAPSALELIRTADKRHRVHFERTEWTMVLQKRGGKKKVRRVEVLRRQDPADRAGDVQRIRFLAPGDIKDTRLLTQERKRASDRQWVYFPAYRQSRRIGTAELGDRFAGTDFNYQDLKRHAVDDYGYRMLREETIAGQACWVIEAIPTAASVKRESPYARTVVWLRKDIVAPIRLRHFDRKNRPLKQITFGKLRQVKGKAWRPNTIVAVDIRRRHRTIVTVTTRTLPATISADLLDPKTFADR